MKKLIVLTSRFPYPLEKGDKLRIYNQIKGLSEYFSITLIAVNDKNITTQQFDALKPFCNSIHVFKNSLIKKFFNLAFGLIKGLPLQVALFYNKEFQKAVSKIINDTNPDVIYCHLIRMSEYVKHITPQIKTLDYMDVFSKGMLRRSEIASFFPRQLFNFEYKRLYNYEKTVFDLFKNKIIISTQDRNEIPHSQNNQIQIVPNGVDFSIFHPVIVSKKYDILFTGHMAYPPNIEAAYFAATKILPFVIKHLPDVKMLIAGVEAPQKIKSLQSDNIDVRGNFNHISEAFAMSRIMIAPMLISIGLQNKILQAFAMKLPVVATTQANDAINATNDLQIMVSDLAEEFASKIIMLLMNDTKRENLANNAYEFVIENYSWPKQNELLKQILLS